MQNSVTGTTPELKSDRRRLVNAFGETLPLTIWSEDPRCKVPFGTLIGRLNRGWEAERALSEPPKVFSGKQKPKKPQKPGKKFPLFAHANRQWAKKINGTVFYFGKWDEPTKAHCLFAQVSYRLYPVDDFL